MAKFGATTATGLGHTSYIINTIHIIIVPAWVKLNNDNAIMYKPTSSI